MNYNFYNNQIFKYLDIVFSKSFLKYNVKLFIYLNLEKTNPKYYIYLLWILKNDKSIIVWLFIILILFISKYNFKFDIK